MGSASDKRQQLEELLKRMERDPLIKRGYVARADADGKVGFVPWQKATTKGKAGKSELKPVSSETHEFAFTPPPILKRTPQQRVESLTLRLMQQVEESIRVYGEPRLPEDVLREIQVEYWKAGIPEKFDYSIENLKVIARKFLQEAELKNKYERKNTNRPSDRPVLGA